MTIKTKIKQITKKINDSEKPVMFYDTDTDGATSYLQMKKAFPKITGFPFQRDLQRQKDLIQKIPQKTDLIVIFDAAFLTQDFLELIKEYEIIWVDHHPTNDEDLIKQYKIVHLNPLSYDKTDNRAASYWAYHISGKIDLSLAVLGSVSDYYLIEDIILKLHKENFQTFNTLFKLTEEKKKELFKFMKKHKFNDLTVRQEIIDWIQYLVYTAKLIEFKNFFDFTFKLEDEKIINAMKLIEKLSIPEIKHAINAGKGELFEDYQNLNKQYQTLQKKASKTKTTDSKILFYEYKSENGFTKTLSEQLCYENKNIPVIAVCFKKKGKQIYNCSFRGNNYIVNSLVEKALEGLDGVGGGHPYAAGMRVAEKDFETFKNNIKKILRQ